MSSFEAFRERVAAARVLVAGDVMLDRYWFGNVERISPEAPVPIVHVSRTDERPGGAANVARNAASLGADVTLLSVVGDDEPARILRKLLGEQRVRPLFQIDPHFPTIVKLRVISRQQQLLRIDFEDPPTATVLRDKLTQYNALLPQYDVIVLSDYAKGSLVNVAQMISAAKQAGKRILVDPKGDDFTCYRGASILTPNKSELRHVVGSWRNEEELTVKAQQLRTSLELEALLLTRSEEGMSLYTDTGVIHIPTIAREVYDVSGAGDTVIATLATMLGSDIPLAEAVSIANRAGGIVVGKLGTATVTKEELFG